jgi:Tfp pilus assembly protein PilF
VDLQFAIGSVYDMVCDKWFPSGEGMDGSKFVKLMKEIPGVGKDKVNGTDLDLIFARNKQKGERRLTKKEFIHGACTEVAKMLYPWLADKPALNKFLKDNLYEWHETQRLMWVEAKRLAVVQEARRHCAAICIQALARGHRAHTFFKTVCRASRILQKKVKAYKHQIKYVKYIKGVRQQKDVARREHAAIRRAKREARLYAHVRLIGGVANIVTVTRHTKGAVLIQCYNPKSGDVFKFTKVQEEIREIVEQATSKAFEDAQLYAPACLEHLLRRLQYRKRVDERAIVFGRKPPKVESGGAKLAVHAVYIAATDRTKHLHVVTVTEARGEYCFTAYNPAAGDVKAVLLPRPRLCEWFGFDEERDKQSVPELLQPQNQKALIAWMLQRMFLCCGCGLSDHYGIHKRGGTVLMLECERGEQRRHTMATRIQCVVRCSLFARRIARQQVLRLYRKQRDLATGRWYCVRRDTGQISWSKPKVMGSQELPDPPDRWEEAWDPSGGYKYYFNPLTGKTSWISEHQAAGRIQKLYRKVQGRQFKLAPAELKTAVSFQRSAKASYEKNPAKLASVVNYALLVHTREHDYKLARELYARALDLAPSSPLVLNAVAIFELVANAYPRRDTFDKAMKRFDEARRNDHTGDKFKPAVLCFFFFAVVSMPYTAHSWLNMAVLESCITKDFDKAERYYRKALEMGPHDQAVIDNYDDFLEQRLPGGRFSGGGPGMAAAKRAYVLAQEGEWCHMQDPAAKKDAFALFWLNAVTQKSQWQEPNWDIEWIQRRRRSRLVNNKDGWSQFLDPVTQRLFYSNEAGQSQWDCPAYLGSAFGVVI